MSNELLPGTILYDHYKIGECISSAEFSNIYIAEDLNKNNKKVIIKELLHKAIGTNDRANALEKFQKEIDVYKKLEHPNMAKIIESFSSESAVYTENKQFIVMEYINGKTLRKIKEEQKEDISPDDAGKWFGQIIEAIKYLSEQEPPVIFYYFTPDHVMITDEGQIKLINFGLGRFFRTGPFKSNQYMGIAGYAAPEQYGIKPVDNRADIFGAGAIAYYMLTQDDPEKHALNFSPVRTLNQMVSMQFARFISKCVQMKAEDRCENINELIEKLNSITFTDSQVSPDKIKKKEEGEKKQKPQYKQSVGKEVSGIAQNFLWTLNKYVPAKVITNIISIMIIVGIVAFLSIRYFSSKSTFPENIIYAIPFEDNKIMVIDKDKKEIFKYINTGECKGKILHFNNKIYTGGSFSSLIVIDAKKAEIVNNIPLPSLMLDFVITKNGNNLYGSSPGKGGVINFSLPTKTLVANIVAGQMPTGIALSDNEHYLYTANFKSNNVNVIDTTNNTNITTIENVGVNPKKLLVIPDKNIMYCVNWGSDNITVINISNNTIVKKVNTGAGPNDILLSPDKTIAYISNNKGQSITMVNTETHENKGEIKIGYSPTCMCISPDRKSLLIAGSNSNRTENRILIFDIATNSNTGEISVPKLILSLCMVHI